MFFFFSYNSYLAIIGKIENAKVLAKDAPNRMDSEKLQCVQEALNRVNEKYKKDLPVPFHLVSDDEIHGMLSNGKIAMDLLFEIERRTYPFDIKYGIGVGKINFKENHTENMLLNGLAYQNAKEAITLLYEGNRKSKSSKRDTYLVASEENLSTVKLLNTILALCTTIKNNWTDRQRQVIYDFEEYGDSQTHVAKRLGITQSSVQKNLAGAEYYSYQEAMKLVVSALSEIRKI